MAFEGWVRPRRPSKIYPDHLETFKYPVGSPASSGRAFVGYRRQKFGSDVDDYDYDSDTNDNNGQPSRGNSNRNGNSRKPNSNNNNNGVRTGNGASRPFTVPSQVQAQDLDGNRTNPPALPPATKKVPFVTIVSTRTETIVVSATNAAPASTITGLIVMTSVDSPAPFAGVVTSSLTSDSTQDLVPQPAGSTFVAAPTASPVSSSSQSGIELSSGSIAAIAIGIIIFITLIMAFIIRMMSFGGERPWTELDRGIPRFRSSRDEEAQFDKWEKLTPVHLSSRQGGLPDAGTFEPTLPPRIHRKPTIRFANPPAQLRPDTNFEAPPVTNKHSLQNPSFYPSTNDANDNDTLMPRAGILLKNLDLNP